MSQQFISHQDVADFADSQINLAAEKSKAMFDLYESMRETFNAYVKAHPDCGMIKMFMSGNLAKGIAGKDFNLIDIAIYVDMDICPEPEPELLAWFAERLRDVYPDIDPQRIVPEIHYIRFDFGCDPADLKVTPIYYNGLPEDRGWQIARETGQRVMTSIPLRVKLIQDCREKEPRHFAQVVRLLDWWVDQRNSVDPEFRFKSILIEIICAHLQDDGMNSSDYPAALKTFFSFIADSGLQRRMLFEGHGSSTQMPEEKAGPVEIFDPYNKENNIANGYTEQDRQRIVIAAKEACEAIAAAEESTTRDEAVQHWQGILGPSFS